MPEHELFRLSKVGATLVGFPDRLEITNRILLAKRRHVVFYRVITGVSVMGIGSSDVVISTAGGRYVIPAGVGAGGKVRDLILRAMDGH